ncbi:MAG: hypothetical protein GY910_02980 [bacterium]|nr:hypothetical protein [Myxococcales bacterium]MCP4903919.1 hypothetical protein [bacterium]
MSAARKKKDARKAEEETTVVVPLSFLEEMRAALKDATATMQSIEQEQAQMRSDMDRVSKHFDEEAQSARDEAMKQLSELLFDERPPAELANDRKLFPVAAKSAGLKAAYQKTVASRARQGRAAKAFGTTVDEWLNWCERFKWQWTDRCPSDDERRWAEGQRDLFEDPPKPTKRPRGRPVGSKDSRPRKKRAANKRPYPKRKSVKAEKK